MSGGVDSSVAAHLLRAQGHDVIGLFMRHGQAGEQDCAAGEPGSLPVLAPHAHKQGCCTASDAADARRVADRLGIPFYAVNFEREFERIVDYFVDEYRHGRTPNPCVMCNNWIKFGKLFAYADSVGAEFVASGHYARLQTEDATEPALLRGRDPDKDQSYVLFGIDRPLLSRLMFPVGQYNKHEIRDIAREIGIRVADKPDSQEICFVTQGHYADFVRDRAGDSQPGEIVTTDGSVVGHHDGIEGFTVGQRKGLGVALGERRYVIGVEPDTARVVIGEREELACEELTASSTNWLVDPPGEPMTCSVQIRYSAAPVPATVSTLPDDCLHVAFAAPQFGIAPGQAVVCYDGERVLGGGWIN